MSKEKPTEKSIEKDSELEAVLKKLMLRVKHVEGESKYSEKKLIQSVKDFLSKETF